MAADPTVGMWALHPTAFRPECPMAQRSQGEEWLAQAIAPYERLQRPLADARQARQVGLRMGHVFTLQVLMKKCAVRRARRYRLREMVRIFETAELLESTYLEQIAFPIAS
jgi:hypothetical protein